MNLVRWDPFREFETLQSRLNRLIDGTEPLTFADWTPAVDIEETDNEYVVKADLPEVKKEDVKVSYESGMLTIEGERQMEKEEKKNRFHKVERVYGKFVRRFAMPTEIDPEHVVASFKDGVLNVHLPKAATSKKAIEVKVA